MDVEFLVQCSHVYSCMALCLKNLLVNMNSFAAQRSISRSPLPLILSSAKGPITRSCSLQTVLLLKSSNKIILWYFQLPAGFRRVSKKLSYLIIITFYPFECKTGEGLRLFSLVLLYQASLHLTLPCVCSFPSSHSIHFLSTASLTSSIQVLLGVPLPFFFIGRVSYIRLEDLFSLVHFIWQKSSQLSFFHCTCYY